MESNNNNSDVDSPRHRSNRRSSQSSGDKDSSDERKTPKVKECNSEKNDRKQHYRPEENQSHPSSSKSYSHRTDTVNDGDAHGDRSRRDAAERDDRRECDKKDRNSERRRDNGFTFQRDRDRHGSRDRDKYDKKYDSKRTSGSGSKRNRSRSRSRDRNSSDRRSRPSSGDRNRSRRRPDDEKSSEDSRDRRIGARKSRSGSPPPTTEYRPSYKVSKKLQAMDKMGLRIKTPDGSMATAQMLMNQTIADQVEKVKSATGVELPKYYNPAAVNPLRYANQIQKRKLLWGNKKKEGEPETSSTAEKWQSTKFAQDSDGKVANKFMRLMGIKEPTPRQPADSGDVVKKREEMFEAMQAQYEVARATTHTMRGVGLGFSGHGKQF